MVVKSSDWPLWVRVSQQLKSTLCSPNSKSGLTNVCAVFVSRGIWLFSGWCRRDQRPSSDCPRLVTMYFSEQSDALAILHILKYIKCPSTSTLEYIYKQCIITIAWALFPWDMPYIMKKVLSQIHMQYSSCTWWFEGGQLSTAYGIWPTSFPHLSQPISLWLSHTANPSCDLKSILIDIRKPITDWTSYIPCKAYISMCINNTYYTLNIVNQSKMWLFVYII